MKKLLSAALLAITAYGVTLPSLASIVITGTRVIYLSNDREVTVKLKNVGQVPSLVQVWADRGDLSTSQRTADAPFLVMPPIFRVDPQKGQSLRITYTGADLPKDRESVFWLNVVDVPPVPQASAEPSNYLQVAVRSRLKLFYRPVGLQGSPEAAAQQLSWQLLPRDGEPGYVLRAHNNSAFFVSLAGVTLRSQEDVYKAKGGMVDPGGHADFVLEGLTSRPSGVLKVDFENINDYGGAVEHHQTLLR